MIVTRWIGQTLPIRQVGGQMQFPLRNQQNIFICSHRIAKFVIYVHALHIDLGHNEPSAPDLFRYFPQVSSLRRARRFSAYSLRRRPPVLVGSCNLAERSELTVPVSGRRSVPVARFSPQYQAPLSAMFSKHRPGAIKPSRHSCSPPCPASRCPACSLFTSSCHHRLSTPSTS